MYNLGDDSLAAAEHLGQSLSIIDHLEKPQTHGWVRKAPLSASEVDHLNRLFPEAPVSLESSLRASVLSALEAAAHLRFTIEAGRFVPSPFRSELRMILVAAGHLSYVTMPETASERREHARKLLALEARSLGGALKDIEKITQLPGLKWDASHVADLRRKMDALNFENLLGDRGLIRVAAELLGKRVANEDSSIDAVTVRDHLWWIWHTSSGAAHGFAWQEIAAGDFITDFGTVVSAFYCAFDAAQGAWTIPLTSLDH